MSLSLTVDAVKHLACLVFIPMPAELSTYDTLSRQLWSITYCQTSPQNDTLSTSVQQMSLVCVCLIAYQVIAFRVMIP